MPLTVAKLPSLVVTTSGVSNAVGILDDAYGLTLYVTTTFTSTAVSVEVEPTDTGTNFVTLQSGGSNVVISSGTATVISPVPFRQLRLATNTNEDSAKTVLLTKAILV